MSTAAAIGQSASPFYQSTSPSLFSLLLEPRSNQRVPGSPSLSPSSIFGTAALSRMLVGANGGSPVGQTVPDFVNIQRSGDHGSTYTTEYSGSPLLRQILRCGRKRQYEDCSQSPCNSTVPTSPSPIAISSKRYRLDLSQASHSLVILERKQSTRLRNRTTPLGYEQVVPHSPAMKPDELVVEEQQQCQADNKETDSCTRQESSVANHSKQVSESKGDVKWFDLLSADLSAAHPEE